MYNQPFNQPMMNNYTMQQASQEEWQDENAERADNVSIDSKRALIFLSWCGLVKADLHHKKYVAILILL